MNRRGFLVLLSSLLFASSSYPLSQLGIPFSLWSIDGRGIPSLSSFLNLGRSFSHHSPGFYNSERDELHLKDSSLKDNVLELQEMQAEHIQLDQSNLVDTSNLSSKELNLSDSELNSSIKGIFKEILDEVRIQDIENKGNSKVSQESKKVTGHSSAYSKSKESIKSFREMTGSGVSLGSGRGKREISSEKLQELSADQRKALQAYLESYIELTKSSGELDEKLNEIRKTRSENNKKNHNYETIKAHLGKIDWDKNTLKIYKINDGGSDPNYGWGSVWVSNPYSSFFKDESSWRKVMKEIKKHETTLKGYRSGFGYTACTLTSMWVWTRHEDICAPKKKEYETKVYSSKAVISLTVGGKLLEIMGDQASE